MLFNSVAFLIFLPIVFLVHWALPHKYRWTMLLIASYYFYMSWNAKYIFLILFTTAVSYFCAIFIEKEDNKSKKRKIVLITSLVCSLGVLFFFKYFMFFNGLFVETLNLFAIKISPLVLQITLPIGISFYTFQMLSYVIDVYKGKIKAERHFGKYATFIAFFPQLVAGPIERTSSLLPQIEREREFSYELSVYGLKLLTWGFFKKIVIADTLAQYVNLVFNDAYNYKGFSLIIASVFFAFQIYCDFSGYSDIALGVSKLFGINLVTNFKSPYFSTSIKDFWSRWHISLSTWFRDYVYIPLGGNRVSRPRHIFNLIITFTISGLWHGANYTFLIWGAIHGLLQTIESLIYRNKPDIKSIKIPAYKIVLKWLSTFIFCVLAWVFFRANSISEAVHILTYMFHGILSPVSYLKLGFSSLQIYKADLFYIFVELLILALYDFKSLKCDVIELIGKMSLLNRWIIYILFALLIIFLLPSVSSSEFIYFQF